MLQNIVEASGSAAKEAAESSRGADMLDRPRPEEDQRPATDVARADEDAPSVRSEQEEQQPAVRVRQHTQELVVKVKCSGEVEIRDIPLSPPNFDFIAIE